MADRSLWLDGHLLDDRAGRQAHAAAEALGPEAHAALLARGDALAAVSAAVAQRYYLRAAALFASFGADGFARWADAGDALLRREPAQREAALAYFSVAPRVARAVGADALVAWCRLGGDAAAVSRKLGAAFFEGSAAVLDRVDAGTLERWAAEGIALAGADGWRGEFRGRALFASAPAALEVLERDDLHAYARLAPALHPAVKEADVFAALPEGLHLLKGEDRRRFFAAVHRAADDDPRAAWAIYRELPAALRRLHVSVRARVLYLLAAAAGHATAELREVLPVVAALVHDVPRPLRQQGLDLGVRVADAFPAGAIAFLRSLPAAFEEAEPAGVDEWVARGLHIAADNPDAGSAFFRRESRTSVKVLHASSTAAVLADVQGLLRKYVQMLSGSPVSIRSALSSQLRPELEEFPLEAEIALPLKLDRFDTHEDNCRLYRVVAAQLAGRRMAGTYAARRPAEAGKSLHDYIVDPERPALLEELFLVAEGFRVASRLARRFAGLAADQRDIALRLLARAARDFPPPQSAALDLVWLWLLTPVPLAELPPWLRALAAVIGPCVAPLALDSASVDDALAVAEELTTQLAARGESRGSAVPEELAFERMASEAIYDMYVDDDGPAAGGDAPAAPAESGSDADDEAKGLDRKLALDEEQDDASGGAPMSAEELQQLLDSGTELRLKQARGDDLEGLGLYVSDLLGKVPRDQLDEIQRVLGEAKRPERTAPRRWLERRAEGATFYYDEWDYHIQDYRERWCRLMEIPVTGDSGEFFHQTLLDYADLIPDVRRQFQKIRPEMYRLVRGLEHGEDFDLNAVVDARIDRRAKRSPSSRLYVARQREERDVATLFLIDLSASTDEPFAPAAAAPETPAGTLETFGAPLPAARRAQKMRRIIDVTREALVIMAEAIEEIGDAYAIYGFSGHGRKNVEYYMVKGFNEALSGAVKGRIGALEPKRSTRMGAALRHSIEKMAAVSARSRHIIMLSDGFPQDFDYGQDRRSNVYGLRDTTVALREAEAAGIVPFCITVDKSGHDYLREMCDESRYMVIDDIASLPAELPKIYQRVVTT